MASPRRGDGHLDADNAHGDTGEDDKGRKRGTEEGDGSGRKTAGPGRAPPCSHGRDLSMSNHERGSTWKKNCGRQGLTRHSRFLTMTSFLAALIRALVTTSTELPAQFAVPRSVAAGGALGAAFPG